MKVIRDRWGDWWVQHHDPSDDDYWYERFDRVKAAHWLGLAWTVLRYAGIPHRDEVT
jgi:hypothetical protein